MRTLPQPTESRHRGGTRSRDCHGNQRRSPKNHLSVAPPRSSHANQTAPGQPKPRAHWEEQLKSGGFHHQLAKAMLARAEPPEIPTEVNYGVFGIRQRPGNGLSRRRGGGRLLRALKREFDWSRWLNAWANDMPGYIPSRRILREATRPTFRRSTTNSRGVRSPVEDKLMKPSANWSAVNSPPSRDRNRRPSTAQW